MATNVVPTNEKGGVLVTEEDVKLLYDFLDGDQIGSKNLDRVDNYDRV